LVVTALNALSDAQRRHNRTALAVTPDQAPYAEHITVGPTVRRELLERRIARRLAADPG
jgi:hypothetical protein